MLHVTRQGYYAWVSRGPGRRRVERARLQLRIKRVFDESRGRYGSPRVHQQLRRQGLQVSRKRVEVAMRSMGLSARRRRSSRRTTLVDGTAPKVSNVLARRFTDAELDQRWVTDITYIRTEQGWSYLAVVLDLCTQPLEKRAVVGWALGDDLTTDLPLRALRMALTRRRPQQPPLHHSDRGCQYTSAAYRSLLEQHGMTASMSRTGNCWDNAVAESFFATLKAELIRKRSWSNMQQLRTQLFEYIESFYNRKRLHSTLGYRTPAEIQRNPRLLTAP